MITLITLIGITVLALIVFLRMTATDQLLLGCIGVFGFIGSIFGSLLLMTFILASVLL
jgi:hypothetical protein